MSTFVIVLRALALLAVAPPLLLSRGRDRRRAKDDDRSRGDRAPVLANFAAFGSLLACLGFFAGDAEGPAAPLLASFGCLLALTRNIVDALVSSSPFMAINLLAPAEQSTPALRAR